MDLRHRPKRTARVPKPGIGTSRVLLPNAIQKLVGPIIDNGEFTASTPNGSLSQTALSDLVEWGKWSDGILFAGDMGRNSETAILIEKFLQQCETITILTKDAIDYLTAAPQVALERPNTALVLSLSQLQRLAVVSKSDKPVTFGMDLLHLVSWLHTFSQQFAPYIVVKHHEYIVVAVNGEVSTTKLDNDIPVWRVKVAAQAAVWWIQNRTRPFEALSTAIHQVASGLTS